MKRYRIVVGLLLSIFLIGGCGASAAPDEGPEMAGHSEMAASPVADEHTGADAHSPAAHGIPDVEASRPNPVPLTDASVAAGKATYTQYCAVCHGEEGEGDGPGAATLEPKPADFHAAHVQELSDGALFYTITHGREGTAMVAWESILSEEQRWELVHFLRTFEAEHAH